MCINRDNAPHFGVWNFESSGLRFFGWLRLWTEEIRRRSPSIYTDPKCLEKDNIFWVGVGGFSTHDAIPNVLQHAQIFCSSPKFCFQQQTEAISMVTSAASVLKKKLGVLFVVLTKEIQNTPVKACMNSLNLEVLKQSDFMLEWGWSLTNIYSLEFT